MIYKNYKKLDNPSQLLENIYKVVNEKKLNEDFIYDPVDFESFAHERREDLLNRGDYDRFSEIISCVKSGHADQLLPLVLAAFQKLQLGEMSTDPLRQAQYTFISIITLISRAAIDAGLERETSFTLSDAYIQKMDKYSDVQQIALLSIQMVFDYTHRISKSQKKREFSYATQSAIEYISLHLNYKITLGDVAGYCNISISHLSATFKSDTLLSIGQYILNQRLHRAKDFLRFSQLGSQEICMKLGFSSPSYFSKVFKNTFSMTPMEYRNKYGHIQLDSSTD